MRLFDTIASRTFCRTDAMLDEMSALSSVEGTDDIANLDFSFCSVCLLNKDKEQDDLVEDKERLEKAIDR